MGGSLAEQAKPGKVAIEDFDIRTPIRTIGWNGVLLHPCAVNVAEKVVLRLDGIVELVRIQSRLAPRGAEHAKNKDRAAADGKSSRFETDR
jgi:hypothetical protein